MLENHTKTTAALGHQPVRGDLQKNKIQEVRTSGLSLPKQSLQEDRTQSIVLNRELFGFRLTPGRGALLGVLLGVGISQAGSSINLSTSAHIESNSPSVTVVTTILGFAAGCLVAKRRYQSEIRSILAGSYPVIKLGSEFIVIGDKHPYNQALGVVLGGFFGSARGFIEFWRNPQAFESLRELFMMFGSLILFYASGFFAACAWVNMKIARRELRITVASRSKFLSDVFE